MNSHSIPEKLWAQAREKLIFYFAHHYSAQNAEDLAHATLLALWKRTDFEFEKEEDFFRVCYGFAKNILLEQFRNDKHPQFMELGPEMEENLPDRKSIHVAETATFLGEVMRNGSRFLDSDEWDLLKSVAERDRGDAPIPVNLRVQAHRIRKKLAKLTGWKKFE
jgi:DNA-directed RNA polymerase specialized sigma24 family protein